MSKKLRFEFVYAEQTERHLQAIDRKYHAVIRKTLDEQLRFEPDVKTRNRKPLRQPAGIDADWEIRFGPNNCFRVFYEVKRELGEVNIVAIGVKIRNRLYIGEKEIAL